MLEHFSKKLAWVLHDASNLLSM